MGFGFVCFEQCEDARKALEFFHEKHQMYQQDYQSSLSKRDVESADNSQGSNFAQLCQSSTPLQALLKSGHRLYVVPALKREQRDAYLRMKTTKFKRQMARQNIYFRGFPMSPDTDIEETQKELAQFFGSFGEVTNVKLMKARKLVKKEDSEEGKVEGDEKLLGFGFVCFKSVEGAQRARVEASKRQFKGNYLFVSQFEAREVRKAHMLEKLDQLEFARYKKKEQIREDSDKLEQLSQQLKTEQGRLFVQLLKVLAKVSEQQK